MPDQAEMHLDVVIFGGGIAGLWTLDALVQAGYHAVLLESNALGTGQTICSQGIIHGGLKYTLDGIFSGAAETIRDMPAIWRNCLAGRRAPRLSDTRIRAEHCHLWRTDDWKSRIGMVGARIGLRVAPVKLDAARRPAALRECPGDVFQLDEQVIDPVSVIRNLASNHATRVFSYDAARFEIARDDGGLTIRAGEHSLTLRPRCCVLAAGAGNEQLRSAFNLAPGAMQRRSLHMLMVRGANLPELNGHCVDGAATRVTITSDRDSSGRTVWQVGGQVGEEGVAKSPEDLIAAGRREIAATIPGIDLHGTEWATYRVDRAEAATDGKRPNDVVIRVEDHVITAWPTKLALAPRLANLIVERVGALVGQPVGDTQKMPADWPRPSVAPPPWEEPQTWFSDR